MIAASPTITETLDPPGKIETLPIFARAKILQMPKT